MNRDLHVVNARQHNLKNVSLTLPRGRLIVITGPSGSGKSSLAFDTIYAEGQRRYVESMNAHARQLLGRLGKPDVDAIDGLSPAIAVEQRPLTRSPRSTVGTVTEIADSMRLLYARVGIPHCPNCGTRIEAHTVQQIVDRILAYPEATRLSVMAPILRGHTGKIAPELERLQRLGFVRGRLDGEPIDLTGGIEPKGKRPHDLDVIVDRIVMKDGLKGRITDSVELALSIGGRSLLVVTADGADLWLSELFACVKCRISLPPIEPRLFSFNGPYGACPSCEGLGTAKKAEDDDEQGGAAPPCPACNGQRLRPEALAVTLEGQTIAAACGFNLDALRSFLTDCVRAMGTRDRTIATPLVDAINERLGFLIDVGLGYLTLSRSAPSLSTGEGQRIRLATQIGSALSGVLYVLDEPSIGLHSRDHAKLIEAEKRLRDLGNTVIVVEHTRTAILAADYVVDMGPGAGVHGGSVMADGTPRELLTNSSSLTAPWLDGRRAFTTRSAKRVGTSWITIVNARANNLRSITARIPLRLFTCVTGVSGSGKSSLIMGTLLPAAKGMLTSANAPVGACDAIHGLGEIDKVVAIDQSPLGRTPRSNPATTMGILPLLGELFAGLPEARSRGYQAGRFSFNIKGGRCETCQGDGVTRVEMHFLPDVFVVCEACEGKRYNRETLEIRYRGFSIADVLAMTTEEASEVFDTIPRIADRLAALRRVGLGYLTLGQSANTLSGGEAQRVKLAREFARKATGSTLYVLDEPTTGLHFSDVDIVMAALFELRDQGNTVIVIEHNLDVVAHADWVIDMGPDGGPHGGRIVAEGPPGTIATCPESHTGKLLTPA